MSNWLDCMEFFRTSRNCRVEYLSRSLLLSIQACSLQKERGTVRAQGGKSGKEEGKEDTIGMEEIGIGDGTHSNPSQG